MEIKLPLMRTFRLAHCLILYLSLLIILLILDLCVCVFCLFFSLVFFKVVLVFCFNTIKCFLTFLLYWRDSDGGPCFSCFLLFFIVADDVRGDAHHQWGRRPWWWKWRRPSRFRFTTSIWLRGSLWVVDGVYAGRARSSSWDPERDSRESGPDPEQTAWS